MFCGRLHFRRTPYPTPAPSLEIPFSLSSCLHLYQQFIHLHTLHWFGVRVRVRVRIRVTGKVSARVRVRVRECRVGVMVRGKVRGKVRVRG